MLKVSSKRAQNFLKAWSKFPRHLRENTISDVYFRFKHIVKQVITKFFGAGYSSIGLARNERPDSIARIGVPGIVTGCELQWIHERREEIECCPCQHHNVVSVTVEDNQR